MSSAALLRKKILSLLQHQILPGLQSNAAGRLMMAHLPLNVPVGMAAREMPPPPLLEADATRIYPRGKEWDAIEMHALQYPSLYCVVKGEAEFAMGVTDSMLGRSSGKSTFKDPFTERFCILKRFLTVAI